MTSKPSNAKDESLRRFITVYITVQAFLLIVFFGCAPFLGFKIGSEEAMGVVELILPLLTGYIGLILGFYFGSQEDK